MVVQFVAFLGAYNDPGALDQWVAAVLASLLVCWVTFVPCFLFVLLGAPYVERLRHNTHLAAALTGVTAAVVGVIANLAAFFALHTLFDETRHVSAGILQLDVPVLGSADPVAFAITAVARYRTPEEFAVAFYFDPTKVDLPDETCAQGYPPQPADNPTCEYDNRYGTTTSTVGYFRVAPNATGRTTVAATETPGKGTKIAIIRYAVLGGLPYYQVSGGAHKGQWVALSDLNP
jgi:hypothetical protein